MATLIILILSSDCLFYMITVSIGTPTFETKYQQKIIQSHKNISFIFLKFPSYFYQN